ncbi:hypothetical protein ACFYXS_35505 [Streptomyces sp. NPDC002574]|uniref:hypothetical protein n=1 Tax=Streptomyces sp. NPDC002574 TaxID=3364652 RepID=UPI003689488C
MSKKKSEPPHGEGPSRFKGDDQHGWSPDVDATRQEENPSAHRSFHPDTYAPGGGNREPSQQEIEESLEGTPVKDVSRSGEERAGKSGKKGVEDTGRRGRSARPSGSEDASEYTSVDPQNQHRERNP